MLYRGLLLFTFSLLVHSLPVLHHQWAALDYDWRSPEQKEQYIRDGSFIVENNALTGKQRHFSLTVEGVKVYKGEIYVTVPRWFNGVPSTLNKVIVRNGISLLQPYPSWEMQKIGGKQLLEPLTI